MDWQKITSMSVTKVIENNNVKSIITFDCKEFMCHTRVHDKIHEIHEKHTTQ